MSSGANELIATGDDVHGLITANLQLCSNITKWYFAIRKLSPSLCLAGRVQRPLIRERRECQLYFRQRDIPM